MSFGVSQAEWAVDGRGREAHQKWLNTQDFPVKRPEDSRKAMKYAPPSPRPRPRGKICLGLG